MRRTKLQVAQLLQSSGDRGKYFTSALRMFAYLATRVPLVQDKIPLRTALAKIFQDKSLRQPGSGTMTIQLDCSTAPTTLMFEHLEAHDADLATPPGFELVRDQGPHASIYGPGKAPSRRALPRTWTAFEARACAKPDLAAPAVLIKRRSDRPTPLAHVRVAIGPRRRFHLYPPTGCVHGIARPVGSSWHT